MKHLTVRIATPDDVPAIIRFQKEMAHETEGMELDDNVLQKGVEAIFNDPSKGFYKVAETEQQIVGCHLITLEWSDWRNASVYWIQSLYILPSYRGKGIFKKMFGELKSEVMNSPEIAGIRLYVEKNNLSAKEAYRNVGMDCDHYHLFEWLKG